MAMTAQGVYIRRASTVTVGTGAASAINVQTSFLDRAAGAGFVADGFTTSMVVTLAGQSTPSTGTYPVKAVAATVLTIWGTFPSTGSTDIVVTGHPMQTIGSITDFAGPGGQAAVIDITHIQSTAKEKMMGLRDEGQLTLTMNYDPTDAGQAGLISDRAARERRIFDMLFTDINYSATGLPSRAWFYGYPIGFSISGSMDGKVAANAVIEIDGPVLWSTHVT